MINLVELKSYLNITDSTKDTFLQTCIDLAIKDLERECNRKFTSGSYTEYGDGFDTDEMFLRNYPVRSLTSLQYLDSDGTLNDVIDDGVHTISDSTLIIDDSYIKLLNGFSFPHSYLIKTIYTAGYTVSGDYGTPADFKKVLLEKAAMHFYNSPQSTQARLGKESRSVGSQNTISENYKDLDHSEFINKNRIRNI